MLYIDDLRCTILLSHLTDLMLKKLLEVTSKLTYDAGEYIFREGEYAGRLFSVHEGRVGLEIPKNPGTQIRLTELTRGMTFGISALVDTENKKYLGHAKSLTNTVILAWKGEALEKLFVEDNEMGYLFMRRIANILNRRLQVTNAQLAEICN
jgi:CRP/FNR family transcriptional regulator, cyclic AMP receptor protein